VGPLATDPPTAEPAYAEDLALARACEAGDAAAWERFVREYRPVLQRAAQAIDPSGGASETADALFGELYAKNLFKYFHGRSRLSTWLRAVLAQRHVDRIRELKKTVALPENDAEWPMAAVHEPPADEHERFVRLVRASLAEAIVALEPRDRLRMRCYYIDGMKLAAIGRLLREHEATASRNLDRTREALRHSVEKNLKSTAGFDARAFAECVGAVMKDPGNIDIAALMEPGDDARSAPQAVLSTRQTKGSGL
jgi:RNA polymerase sigma-70 factor (ECF subfamily)